MRADSPSSSDPKTGTTADVPETGGFGAGLVEGLFVLGWGVLLAPFGLLAILVAGAGADVLGGWLAAPAPLQAAAGALKPLVDWGASTALVSCLTSAVALVVAIPLAALLARTNVPARPLWWLGVLLLACTPLYVTTTAWVHTLSLPFLTQTWAHKLLGAGLIMGLAYSPLATLLVAAGLQSISPEVEEAALLGCPPARVFLRVTLPLAGWSVGAAALLTAVLAATEITVTDAVWARTYAEQIFLAFRLEWNTGRATLQALPLLVAALAACVGLAPAVRRFAALPLTRLTAGTRSFALGIWRRPAACLPALAVAVFVYPLAELAWFVCQTTSADVLWGGMEDQVWLAARSVGLAAAGATLAVGLATPCAWLLRRSPSRPVKTGVWSALLLMLATPAPVAGMALIKFWKHPFWYAMGLSRVPELVYDTPAIVVLLYAVRTIPLAVLVIWIAFCHLPEAFWEAARVHGIGGWAFVRRVALPLSGGALAGAWLIAYVLSLAEVGGAVVVSPPGVDLFAVQFANQIHYSTSYPALGRMILVPLALAVVPAGAVAWLVRCRSRASGEEGA